MAILSMMVGIPASGKSTYAMTLAAGREAVLISSDDVREVLFGDVSEQRANGLIFEVIHKAIIENLKMNKHVVFDATNISRKNRTALIKNISSQVKGTYFEAHYFSVPLDVAKERNKKRSRFVPEHIIEKMFIELSVPTMDEGFDIIFYYPHGDSLAEFDKVGFEKFISEKLSKDDFFNELEKISYFSDIKTMQHDNHWHKESIGDHIYNVYSLVYDYNIFYRLELIFAAVFHDVGKFFTKKPSPKVSGEYVFYNHENVSAQIASVALDAYPCISDFDFAVKAIKYHMLAHNNMALAEQYFSSEELEAFRIFVKADDNGKEKEDEKQEISG